MMQKVVFESRNGSAKDIVIPKSRRTRIHNSLALQTPLAWSDVYEYRDLNALISAPENAEDSILYCTEV